MGSDSGRKKLLLKLYYEKVRFSLRFSGLFACLSWRLKRSQNLKLNLFHNDVISAIYRWSLRLFIAGYSAPLYILKSPRM